MEPEAERRFDSTGPRTFLSRVLSARAEASHAESEPARILDVGMDGGVSLAWFLEQGCRAEGIQLTPALADLATERTGAPVRHSDPRLLSLPKEKYDGIWCDRLIARVAMEHTQRVLLAFFAALKPRTGLLFLSFLTSHESNLNQESGETLVPAVFSYPAVPFLALVRQSGFTVLLQGTRVEDGREWMALIARRA